MYVCTLYTITCMFVLYILYTCMFVLYILYTCMFVLYILYTCMPYCCIKTKVQSNAEQYVSTHILSQTLIFNCTLQTKLFGLFIKNFIYLWNVKLHSNQHFIIVFA
jgi:hypothetical protein